MNCILLVGHLYTLRIILSEGVANKDSCLLQLFLILSLSLLFLFEKGVHVLFLWFWLLFLKGQDSYFF